MSSMLSTLFSAPPSPTAHATATRATRSTAMGGASSACMPGMRLRSCGTGAQLNRASSGLQQLKHKVNNFIRLLTHVQRRMVFAAAAAESIRWVAPAHQLQGKPHTVSDLSLAVYKTRA